MTKIQLSDHFNYQKIFRFVIPSIGMMVFTSIYSVVDGYFVSNYAGDTPFAAINMIMPFLMILSSIGFMFGAGGTALISYHLGEGNKEKAKSVFSLLTYIVIIFGTIISIIGILLLEPIAKLLGVTDILMPYCLQYGRIILIGNVPFMLLNMYQSYLILAEKPKIGFAITVLAGCTNMVLDYVFVGKLAYGVTGAAWATIISNTIGGLIPFIYFLCPNSSLLRLGKAEIDLKAIYKTCTNGASEFVTNISLSIVSMIYNYQLMKYAGEDGVATYGVIMYVGFVFVAISIGYSMGVAPLFGYNYGAKNHKELKNIFRKSIIILSVISGVLFLSSELLSGFFAKLYVGYNAELYQMTKEAFTYYSISFLLVGINIFASSFFTALSNGKVSAIISFSRTFIFQIIIVVLLPILFGLNGIWWATTVAETMAFILSLCFFLFKRKVYHY